MGIRMMTIQAPWVNLVEATITVTRPVVRAPIRLTGRLYCQPGSRRVHQRLTMPACDSGNEGNTPTAYSGINWWGSAANQTARIADSNPRGAMPGEKASRPPPKPDWGGMERSAAREPP